MFFLMPTLSFPFHSTLYSFVLQSFKCLPISIPHMKAIFQLVLIHKRKKKNWLLKIDSKNSRNSEWMDGLLIHENDLCPYESST